MMKILVLTKRQYMGKDLLDDRFGRFRELPLELARMGHQVRGVCLSYRPRMEGPVIDRVPTDAAQVTWHSVNLGHRFLPSLPRYFRQVQQLIESFQPDVIWTGSDALHAIFGYRLAREVPCKLVVDLYDNFEAFAATKLPGVLSMFRTAVKSADGITVFSQRLADYIIPTYPVSNAHAIILNGVRKDLFFRRDQRNCRRDLRLPLNTNIIGVAGALHWSRSIDDLFSAFEILAGENPDLHLALAGPRDKKQFIPIGPRIHDFRELPHEQIPMFVNALDLAVICYRQSPQGEYSFPQKAYEIIACGVPMVAAAVGTMKELLRNHPECLYEPGNPQDLARVIRLQLERKTNLQIPVPSWSDSAAQLNRFLQGTVGLKSKIETAS
jgi:teichuronic acid biosynthesis glycosyltransferase TuaC